MKSQRAQSHYDLIVTASFNKGIIISYKILEKYGEDGKELVIMLYMAMKNLVDIVIQGGFVMIPLGLCSLMLGAVSIQKFRLFRSCDEGLGEIREQLKAQGLSNEQSPVFLTQAFADLQKTWPLNADKLDTFISRSLWDFEESLSYGLWLVGSTATLAPFIGLFGTVVGIIKSFSSIADAGKGGFAIVSADLSEALIATAAGILVAIAASFFYNYFIQRIEKLKKRYVFLLEEYSEVLEN